MHTPLRGQIYRLKADAVGKKRPVLIISRNELNKGNTVIAVPFTSEQIEKRRRFSNFAEFEIGEGGLEEHCLACGAQVTVYLISNLRISEGPMGTLSDAQIARVMRAVNWSIQNTTTDDAKSANP